MGQLLRKALRGNHSTLLLVGDDVHLPLAHVGGQSPWPLRLPSRFNTQQVADEVILLTAFPVGG
ncbi:MAG: hypothetical protein OSA48_11965, partial [Akkermansiaceae bacterium]|nr:hypothetical protein [Akkermansiaceae bacterium]